MHHRHPYPVIFIWILMLGSISLRGQDPITYGEADSVSYRLYLEENWKALKPYSESAIRQGLGSYYLHVRAGIACYSLKQYRAAIPHFKKALLYAPGDELAMNYLYWCYLYAERFEDAKRLSRNFSPAQAETMKTASLPAIDFVSAEGGMKFSDSASRFKNPVIASLGLGHSISRRFSLYHSFTYFGQSETRFEVNQFQYYLRASLPLRPDLLLSLGAHAINDQVYAPITYTLPGKPPPPPQPGQPPPPTPAPRTIVDDTNTVSNSFIGAVTLSRQGRLFNYSLGLTGAYLDTARQYGISAGISFFPLQNNRLSFGGTVYQHTENEFKTSDLAFVPFLSAYVSPKLFLTFTYLNNRGSNVIENTGYGFNNSIDYTVGRYTLSASCRISKKVWAYGLYGYETKKHLEESFTYHYHLFLIGLKIIP